MPETSGKIGGEGPIEGDSRLGTLGVPVDAGDRRYDRAKYEGPLSDGPPLFETGSSSGRNPFNYCPFALIARQTG